MFVVSRAEAVLTEVISNQATPVCRGAVSNILSALVGQAAVTNMNSLVYIRGESDRLLVKRFLVTLETPSS